MAAQWEPISDAQLAALVKWRAEMGVSWRAKLLAAWECAGRGYSSYAPELQQLRNGWGPSWLVKFKIPPRTECEPPMSSAPAISGDALTAGETIEIDVDLPRPDRFASRAYDPQALRFTGNREIPTTARRPLRNRATPEIIVTLTEDQAQALEWFARHLAFSDALDSTPPHLGKEIRTERAYGIVHAAAALEEQLRTAGMRGDSWMYAS